MEKIESEKSFGKMQMSSILERAQIGLSMTQRIGGTPLLRSRIPARDLEGMKYTAAPMGPPIDNATLADRFWEELCVCSV